MAGWSIVLVCELCVGSVFEAVAAAMSITLRSLVGNRLAIVRAAQWQNRPKQRRPLTDAGNHSDQPVTDADSCSEKYKERCWCVSC